MAFQENTIAKSFRKIVGDKKSITQITFLETIDYVGFWREITVYVGESTKHFISLVRKLEDVKASDSDLISRLREFNAKKLEKRISHYKMWEGLNITLSTILTMAMFVELDKTANSIKSIKELYQKIKKELVKKKDLHYFMNDILDTSVNLILEGELFKVTRPCLDFFTSVICYINEAVIENSESSREIYKDIFVHYGLRYDLYNFQKEMKLLFPVIAYDTGEYSFVFQYVKEELVSNSFYFTGFIEEFNKKLKLNCLYMRDFPERSGKSILACLFCLEVFLNKYPFFTPVSLKKLMFTVSSFICWPDPVGTQAMKLYNKMLIENLFPSINQFNYLRKILPTNDYFNPFLRDVGLDAGREIRLEAMLFSDTSSMVQ